MRVDQSQRSEVRDKFTGERSKWQESYGQELYAALGLQWRQANGVRLCEETVPLGGRILDAGCGCGHASVALGQRGYEVLGIDLSEAMIAQARENAAAAGLLDRLDFAVADFSEFSAVHVGEFAGVLGLGFIEYFDDPVNVLKGCRGCLEPGGVAVIQFWNPRSTAARIFDPMLLRMRSLLRPLETIRRHGRRLADGESRKKPDRGHVFDSDDVLHRRYTPARAHDMAASAGLTPVASAGSLFFSARTPLSDPLKARLDLLLQKLARRSTWLRRGATDYVLACRK